MDMFSRNFHAKNITNTVFILNPLQGQFHPRLMTVIMFDAGQLCCASQASVCLNEFGLFIWSTSQSSESSRRCSHNHNSSLTHGMFSEEVWKP